MWPWIPVSECTIHTGHQSWENIQPIYTTHNDTLTQSWHRHNPDTQTQSWHTDTILTPVSLYRRPTNPRVPILPGLSRPSSCPTLKLSLLCRTFLSSFFLSPGRILSLSVMIQNTGQVLTSKPQRHACSASTARGWSVQSKESPQEITFYHQVMADMAKCSKVKLAVDSDPRQDKPFCYNIACAIHTCCYPCVLFTSISWFSTNQKPRIVRRGLAGEPLSRSAHLVLHTDPGSLVYSYTA